jgi:CheY-like chemotaxis protein
VLVVDDEPMMRSLMTQTLQPHYHVLAAADGQEAVDLARGLSPDLGLVVTDIQMPRLNGIALATQLRQLDRPPAVLFISGFAQQAVPGPILPKPFRPEALLSTVSRLLAAGHQV